jgi:hypothetical protein
MVLVGIAMVVMAFHSDKRVNVAKGARGSRKTASFVGGQNAEALGDNDGAGVAIGPRDTRARRARMPLPHNHCVGAHCGNQDLHCVAPKSQQLGVATHGLQPAVSIRRIRPLLSCCNEHGVAVPTEGSEVNGSVCMCVSKLAPCPPQLFTNQEIVTPARDGGGGGLSV